MNVRGGDEDGEDRDRHDRQDREAGLPDQAGSLAAAPWIAAGRRR
jgi:hypothetical protein